MNHEPPPLRHCEEQGDEAIHKPQKVNTKNKKEKEFPAFYQVKKLIFNEILIFNFQFLIFNFLWIATSCKSNSRNDNMCWRDCHRLFKLS